MQTNSSKSAGPEPRKVSTDSRTSRALPAANPIGESISVRVTRVEMPNPLPVETIDSANTRASSSVCMKAARPTLMSITSAANPSAAFFDRIEPVISGVEAMRPVTSRIAYIRLSAGAISPVCPPIIHPIVWTIFDACSGVTLTS